MSQIAGSTILVTGAGSGLGRRMSIKMADMGARMVLWDINREAVDKVRDEIATASAEPPFADVCDVSNRHEVYAAAERVKSEVGPVDVLVNNAGIVSGRDFLECSDEQIERTGIFDQLQGDGSLPGDHGVVVEGWDEAHPAL